jgi:hypothetical protein
MDESTMIDAQRRADFLSLLNTMGVAYVEWDFAWYSDEWDIHAFSMLYKNGFSENMALEQMVRDAIWWLSSDHQIEGRQTINFSTGALEYIGQSITYKEEDPNDWPPTRRAETIDDHFEDGEDEWYREIFERDNARRIYDEMDAEDAEDVDGDEEENDDTYANEYFWGSDDMDGDSYPDTDDYERY